MYHAETRLRALMLAGLGGDAQAYRNLLQELSVYLRAYYRRREFRRGVVLKLASPRGFEPRLPP